MNVLFEMSLKRLCYDLHYFVLRYRGRAVGLILVFRETKVCHWRNEREAIYFCKAATKCFAELRKKDTHYYMKFYRHDEMCAKGLPGKQQTKQMSEGETVRSLEINGSSFNAIRGLV